MSKHHCLDETQPFNYIRGVGIPHRERVESAGGAVEPAGLRRQAGGLGNG